MYNRPIGARDLLKSNWWIFAWCGWCKPESGFEGMLIYFAQAYCHRRYCDDVVGSLVYRVFIFACGPTLTKAE